jgi:hypothetical protein
MAGCLLVSRALSGSGAWIELGGVSMTGVVCYIGALALFDPGSLTEVGSLVSGRGSRARDDTWLRRTVDVPATGDTR